MFERRDTPFAHWVDDEFLTVEHAAAVAEEFPPPGPGWQTFTGAHENGKGQRDRGAGPFTDRLLEWLSSVAWTATVETLTGISPLRADLLGGGLHQTAPGGHLDVHVDYNTHPRRPGWRRALNLLVYLNAGWNPGDGGELELGVGEGRVTIAPIAGRAVLFPTNDTSWHGHPNPVGPGWFRRSIAVYYFTPGQVDRGHSTEWHRA